MGISPEGFQDGRNVPLTALVAVISAIGHFSIKMKIDSQKKLDSAKEISKSTRLNENKVDLGSIWFSNSIGFATGSIGFAYLVIAKMNVEEINQSKGIFAAHYFFTFGPCLLATNQALSLLVGNKPLQNHFKRLLS